MSHAGKTRPYPLNVVAGSQLFVPGCRACPVIKYRRWIALFIAGRIAETVKEIPGEASGGSNTGLIIARDEGATVVDNIELSLKGVDDHLIQLTVEID